MGGVARKDGDAGVDVNKDGKGVESGTVDESGSGDSTTADPLVDSLVKTDSSSPPETPPDSGETKAPVKKAGFWEKRKQKAVEKKVERQAESPDKFEAAVGEKKWSTAGNELFIMAKAAADSKWDAASAETRQAIAKALRAKKPTGDVAAEVLKSLAARTPDGEDRTTKYLFSARFHMMASGAHLDDDGITWTKAGILRSWDVLELLPQKHTSKNIFLKNWTRYASASGNGYYGALSIFYSEAAMGYKDDTEIGTKVNTTDSDESPFKGKNEFDNTCRHEVGHAVDKKIGGARRLASKDANGNWKSHGGGGKTLAKTLIAKSGGPINEQPDEVKKGIIQILGDAMSDGTTDVTGAIQQHLQAAKVKKGKWDAILADPAIQTVLRCGRDKSPWYNEPDGGPTIGGRVYQESYPGTWVSYLQEARSRMVSKYQWRADGEWFAEVYATYYLPGEGPQKLGAIDSASKTWFDKNVK